MSWSNDQGWMKSARWGQPGGTQAQIIAYPSAEIFREKIKNQRISAMDRRGKFLILVLESGDRIILHLRMPGCLLVTMYDEPLTITILVSYLDTAVKWGLFFGFSSRPMMPVALKVMISKKPQKESGRLNEVLKISKEDIKLMKLYNMIRITGECCETVVRRCCSNKIGRL